MKKRNSLRAHLLIPIILNSLILLTVTIVLLGHRQLNDAKQNVVNQARANLQLIADYASIPLIFDQPGDAKEVLSRLVNVQSVLSAAIYSEDATLFASFGVDSIIPSPHWVAKQIRPGRKSMFIAVPIVHRDLKYGTLVAEIDLSAQKVLMRELIWLLVTVFVATGLLAVLLALLFERRFLKPILLLTEKFREISTSASFVKAPDPLPERKQGSNELEILFAGYNKMVAALIMREKKQSEAESALKDMNEKLESKVAKKTRELRLAKERAEESDRLKSAFLANMSHEIRTPLNAIVGFTGMLVTEDFDPETKNSYLRIVEENTDSLLKLIEDILDLSKLESGSIDINPKETDLIRFGQGIYENSLMMRDRMSKPQCEINLDLPSSGDDVTGFFDSLRIRQVVLNLINNALKFTDQGSITFGIRNAGTDHLFYVKDTGIGIDENDHDHVFDRFYKNDKKKKLYTGTGLGLPICKNIIELSGGKIWFETKPGKGTTFFFTIPGKPSCRPLT